MIHRSLLGRGSQYYQTLVVIAHRLLELQRSRRRIARIINREEMVKKDSRSEGGMLVVMAPKSRMVFLAGV